MATPKRNTIMVPKPFEPERPCPRAKEDADWNAWLAGPKTMGPFYAREYGYKPREREHVVTTSDPIAGYRGILGMVPPHRHQVCSCGLSWTCDAPEERARFLWWGGS